MFNYLHNDILMNKTQYPIIGKIYDPIPKHSILNIFIENFYLIKELIDQSKMKIDEDIYRKLTKFKLKRRMKYMMNLNEIDIRTIFRQYYIPNEFLLEVYKEKNITLFTVLDIKINFYKMFSKCITIYNDPYPFVKKEKTRNLMIDYKYINKKIKKK